MSRISKIKAIIGQKVLTVTIKDGIPKVKDDLIVGEQYPELVQALSEIIKREWVKNDNCRGL